MAKIKGWEKDMLFSDTWRSINHKGITINTRYQGNVNYGYEVFIYDGIGMLKTPETIEREVFDTKQQALDYAIKYMKSHPRG